MAQIWTSYAAYHHNLNINSFSGGTEITATASQVLDTFDTIGFDIKRSSAPNGIHFLTFSDSAPKVSLQSKLYNDARNPQSQFIAVMTCSDADENCPLVIGCVDRIALTHDDPKHFDGSSIEKAMYTHKAYQIGTEIMYAFSLIKTS